MALSPTAFSVRSYILLNIFLLNKGCNICRSKIVVTAGCKESHFHSLSFGQAVASMYQPTSHFS